MTEDNLQTQQGLSGADAPVENDAVATPVENDIQEQNGKLPPLDQHPRFKEVYGKMKNLEREMENTKKMLADKDTSLEAIRKHNEALNKTLEKFEERFDAYDVKNKPDPMEDPEGYHAWAYAKAMRDVRKEMDKRDKPPTPPVDNVNNPRLAIQEEVVASMHDDYYEAMEEVKRDMAKDSVLRNEIFGAANPPAKAYKYWQDKKAKADSDKQQKIDQGYVESASYPAGSGGKIKLTAEQERVSKMLGIKTEDYIKQLTAIKKGGAA